MFKEEKILVFTCMNYFRRNVNQSDRDLKVIEQLVKEQLVKEQ